MYNWQHIAYLYFESIHPFEDGNGRIGRVISERALANSLAQSLPFSLSHAINQDVKLYYQALQAASFTLDLTAWLSYFIEMCLLGIQLAEEVLIHVNYKSNFYHRFTGKLNLRQEKALQKMFSAGPKWFIFSPSQRDLQEE